jgi:hypothetical protein
MAQAQTGCDAIERIPVGHTFASAAKQITSRGVRSPQRPMPPRSTVNYISESLGQAVRCGARSDVDTEATRVGR